MIATYGTVMYVRPRNFETNFMCVLKPTSFVDVAACGAMRCTEMNMA